MSDATFDDYQQRATVFAIYRHGIRNVSPSPLLDNLLAIFYACAGLTGEAGEVAGKIKKVLRDNGGELNEFTRNDIVDELGDVLWYLSELSAILNVPLSVVAANNLKKLSRRADAGKLKGDGDKR